MNIIPFEDLRVTTMTIVMTLSNGVNTNAAFHLLPITRVAIQQKRESSKCALPHCKIPGSILSMRNRDSVRGVIRSKTSPFKNAVTIDISTTKKNISLKLSSFSIQMCGASSREDGIEAATHLLNHLKSIQRNLEKIQSDIESARQAIEWVKTITKGPVVEKSGWQEIPGDNVNLTVYRPSMDNSIIKPIVIPTRKLLSGTPTTSVTPDEAITIALSDNENVDIKVIPEHIDEDIAMFLLTLCDDFIYHSDMCRKLDYIPNIHTIINEPLELSSVEEAMVNYNYSLGFEIDRDVLNQLIDGRNGFISHFNIALSNSVTIELPYEIPEHSTIKRRKNKIPHTTFLVYKSGSVTQSARGGPIMRESYYLFMNTIAELLPYIQYNPQTSHQMQ